MNERTIGKVTRWTARFVGTTLVGFMLLFFVAAAFSPEGLPRVWKEPPSVQLDCLALFLMIAGCAVGWRWEAVASFMTISGYLIWQLVEQRTPWPPTWLELVFATGLLYALSWWSTTRTFTTQRRMPSRT